MQFTPAFIRQAVASGRYRTAEDAVREALTRWENSERARTELMAALDEATLLKTLAAQSGLPHVWLRRGLVDPEVVALVPQEKARLYSVVPMFPRACAARTRTSGIGSAITAINGRVAFSLPMRPSFSAASARRHHRPLASCSR